MQLRQNIIGKSELHLKSVIFERDNLQMELEEAINQIDKLEQAVEVARQEGIEEGMHTQMDIRQNPYEDFEEIQDKKKIADHTFDCLETPFDDNDLGKLEIKTVPKVPTLGKVAPSQEIPGLQVTNDPFKKKTAPLGNARQKVKIAKLGVPSLDLSSLKNVKEYKDWYGYSQKLENAIRLMREKIESLENYKEMTDL